jgi:hypothetical protein
MKSRCFFRCLIVAASLPACGDPTGGENVDDVLLALDVCGETVPANRAVDGIPAYSQCDATMNSSIWSNNGVDTSITSLGPDWVQTQRGGGYQCTELAYRYMRFRWNVSYRSGDAQEWCDGDLPANLVKSTTPVHGDLIVFAGGVCGAAQSTGHIAVIDTVDGARGTVTIVEENRAGRRSTQQSCATCFLHATANDGAMGGAAGMAGAAGSGGPGGGAGMGPMGGSGSGASVGGTSGSGGSASGAGGSAGESDPPVGGSAGTNTGTSGMGGSVTTGGSGGSGFPMGGAHAAGTLGNAGSGPAGVGGAGGAGTTGGPGVSGASTEPAVSDSTLEGGCSLSSAPRRKLGGLAHAILIAFAFGLVGWRRKRRDPGERRHHPPSWAAH